MSAADQREKNPGTLRAGYTNVAPTGIAGVSPDSFYTFPGSAFALAEPLANGSFPPPQIVLPIGPGPKSNRASLMLKPATSMRLRSVVPIPASSASLIVLSP